MNLIVTMVAKKMNSCRKYTGNDTCTSTYLNEIELNLAIFLTKHDLNCKLHPTTQDARSESKLDSYSCFERHRTVIVTLIYICRIQGSTLFAVISVRIHFLFFR